MGTPRAKRAVRATEKAVRGIVQEGVDGNIPGMQDQLCQRIDYEVKRAAGETVFQNAARDRRYVRFARVPSGIGETCDFCIMLASRGFVYHTEATAGELKHYHANCRCRIVPGFQGETTVEGYDPDVYYRMWKGEELSKNAEIGEGRGDFTTISLNPDSKLFTIKDGAELKEAIEESLRCETTDGFNKLPHEIKQYLAADMEAFFEDYPMVRGNISIIGVSKDLKPNEAMVAFPVDTMGNIQVLINRNIMYSIDSIGSRYASSLESGHSINGSSWPSLGYHELGHSIESHLTAERYAGSTSEFFSAWRDSEIAEEIVQSALEDIGKGSEYWVKWAGTVSNYAAESPSEAICEALKEVRVRGTEASSFSTAIAQKVKERLNG